MAGDLCMPVYMLPQARSCCACLLRINMVDSGNALPSLLYSTARMLARARSTCWCCHCRLQALECLLLCTSCVHHTSLARARAHR